MNYYIPYGNMPYLASTARTGLLSRIFRNGINWGSILTNTQKALNIVNQTIPVVKQMGPMMNNAKTMFKVMNEFKKVETPNNTNKKEKKQIIETKKTIRETNSSPTFFK